MCVSLQMHQILFEFQDVIKDEEFEVRHRRRRLHQPLDLQQIATMQ